jgi:hypothetical protein
MELKEQVFRPTVQAAPARAGALLSWVAGVSDYLTVAALTGILFCTTLLMGHFTTFFTVDQDIKYLAASNLKDHWNNAAIPYPFAHFDPQGLYTLPFTAWIQGHQYSGYSLPFEYLGAVSISLFGAAGLALPALLGTAALLTIQLQLASLLGLRGRRSLLVIATVVATPIFFYSLLFWEHTLGVALLLSGAAVLLTLATREHTNLWGAGLAGGLLAAGVLMRREVVIPAVVALLLIPILFRRRDVLVMAGIAAATFLIPLGIIYELHPQPLVLGLTHASPGRAGISPGATSSRLRRLEWLTSGGYATALFALCTAFLVGIRQLKRKWLPTAVALCSVAVGLTFVIQLFSHYTWSNLNPLAFCPLAVWGLWAALFVPPRGPARNLFLAVWGLVVAGAVGTTIMAADFGGAQWGPRYLLFVFPLLILLAFVARQEMRQTATGTVEKRAVEFSFVGVLALSILLQGAGVMAIVKAKQELSASQAAVAQLQPRIVASADVSIDGLAPLVPNKMLLFAPSRGEFPKLLAAIRRSGARSVIVICGPTFKCQWNGYAGWSHGPIRTKNRRIFRYAVYTSR